MIPEAIEVYIESLVAHADPIPGPVEIERVTVAARRCGSRPSRRAKGGPRAGALRLETRSDQGQPSRLPAS
jgi:hypothetical protein